MILQYKCGHEIIGPLWKDGLVVRLDLSCPRCLGKERPKYVVIVKGERKLIIKRAWR